MSDPEQLVPCEPALSKLFPHLKGNERPVLIWPNSTLNNFCKNVTLKNEHLAQVILDMIVTMKNRNGVGLAAPQIGELLNMFVIDTEHGPLTLINPSIIDRSMDLFKVDEGCLSVPGYFEYRERPRQVTIEYQDFHGQIYKRNFENLTAFVIQHEMDHLQGKLFVDELSPLKKSRVRKKISKTLRG